MPTKVVNAIEVLKNRESSKADKAWAAKVLEDHLRTQRVIY